MPGNPFHAKLNFQVRCFIYAAHHLHLYSYPVLGRAFDCNPETIALICRATAHSRSYRSVFIEKERIGIHAMWERYALDTWVERVKNALKGAAQDRWGGAYPFHQAKPMVEVQQADGEGTYYLHDTENKIIPVRIRSMRDILKDENYPHELPPEFNEYFCWSKLDGGVWLAPFEDGHGFDSVQDMLRYFAAYPEDLGYMGNW
jgi:hypothetical protein